MLDHPFPHLKQLGLSEDGLYHLSSVDVMGPGDSGNDGFAQ